MVADDDLAGELRALAAFVRGGHVDATTINASLWTAGQAVVDSVVVDSGPAPLLVLASRMMLTGQETLVRALLEAKASLTPARTPTYHQSRDPGARSQPLQRALAAHD